MQRIRSYLTTFLAVLAGVVALWLGTMMFFTILAFGVAAAIAFRLGTGPRPITLRARPVADPAPRHQGPERGAEV